MKTYLMKKAMIETAVDQGIKAMEDDPKRSVRRLTDLGSQFSNNRFQDMLFSVMQELLNNENSAYYDMIQNLLKNTDHEAIKKFGVNFGYMGWNYGAALIRENESKLGFYIPWTLLLRYDPSCSSGLGEEKLAKLFEEGQELGIYTYFIRENAHETDDSYALLELMERYKDCAFVWLKGNGRLTAAQIQSLKLCKGTLLSLPVEDPETMLSISLLIDQGIPFALHMEYDGSETMLPDNDKALIIDKVLASETAFFFLIGKDNATVSAGKLAHDSRMEQNHPFVTMDYYYDGTEVSKMLCEHPYLLELDVDGTIIHPNEKKGKPFPFELSLQEALRQTMAPFPIKKEA